MRQAVLWDSSAILALLDTGDADHNSARHIARELATRRRPCFITNYIQAEAHALLLRRLGRTLALHWLTQGALPVMRATPAEEDSARALLSRHDDKDWSFCDAISFALMEARGVGEAFSYDRHFVQFGRVAVLGAGGRP